MVKLLRRAAPHLVLAALLALVAGLLHALGWREHTSVLSGTAPGSGGSAVQGLLYVLAWFGAVVVAPIAALAGLLVTPLERALRPRRPPEERSPA